MAHGQTSKLLYLRSSDSDITDDDWNAEIAKTYDNHDLPSVLVKPQGPIICGDLAWPTSISGHIVMNDIRIFEILAISDFSCLRLSSPRSLLTARRQEPLADMNLRLLSWIVLIYLPL